ncbi:MAG: triose-phosphate isomerase [Pseudomonadota bacterium]
MTPLIAGNWKMNGVMAALDEVDAFVKRLGDPPPADRDVLICPPATLLGAMTARLAVSGVKTGGQDCHAEASGAHTGDLSAEMLRDSGAHYVIVGHSERRADHGESDQTVRAKAAAAQRAGLVPIICVGETRDQREAGEETAIVGAQLEGSIPSTGDYVVAYEPVWAIGTGLTPVEADIASMHAFIRDQARDEPRILYGGSVKPSNAGDILAIDHVNGALVGGASLKADDFYAIINAVHKA